MNTRDDLVQQLLELDSDIEAAIKRQLAQSDETQGLAQEHNYSSNYIEQLKRARAQLVSQIERLPD